MTPGRAAAICATALVLVGCSQAGQHLTAAEALRAFDDDTASHWHSRMPHALDAGSNHQCMQTSPTQFSCETMVSAGNESLPLIVDGTVTEHGSTFTVDAHAH